MALYLDTEFNGHAGQLISLALASDDGDHWYEVLPEPDVWDEWCAEHVKPHLGKSPVDADFFRTSLQTFLEKHTDATIFADWPDDFGHLMSVMSGPSYDKSFSVDCRMRLVNQTDPQPETPHNALSDAIALMRWIKHNRDKV